MSAKNKWFPIVAQLLFLPDIVLEVQEGDLLSGIDSLIDTINDQVYTLVTVGTRREQAFPVLEIRMIIAALSALRSRLIAIRS